MWLSAIAFTAATIAYCHGGMDFTGPVLGGIAGPRIVLRAPVDEPGKAPHSGKDAKFFNDSTT